jgi:phosphoribosylformimino-5-aminoimidazole carboxamide ribotide isomerase
LSKAPKLPKEWLSDASFCRLEESFLSPLLPEGIAMILFPAIDLQNGCCVRLSKGDFSSTTLYEQDPLKQASLFAEAGAEWLHIVDLDGARDEQMDQIELIEKIARNIPLRLQIGGGIRQEQQIDHLFAAGASRLVIGSLAVHDPDLVISWLRRYGGEKLVLALDVRLDSDGMPEVLTKGWQEGSHQSLWDILNLYKAAPLQTILCTDIARDGMLQGVNLGLYKALRDRYPKLGIIASGGVGSMEDLKNLAAQKIDGVIIGKAFYEKKINAKAAFSLYGGL